MVPFGTGSKSPSTDSFDDLVGLTGAGGDPTRGGPGHVERATGAFWPTDVSLDARPTTIGGNEGNRWVEATLDLRGPDVRGVIRVDPTIGLPAVARARAELSAGVAERPGASHHPQIQAYHAGARRGGSPLAGTPGHEGEGMQVLPRASDETAWCASGASWCAYGVQRTPA